LSSQVNRNKVTSLVLDVTRSVSCVLIQTSPSTYRTETLPLITYAINVHSLVSKNKDPSTSEIAISRPQSHRKYCELKSAPAISTLHSTEYFVFHKLTWYYTVSKKTSTFLFFK